VRLLTELADLFHSGFDGIQIDEVCGPHSIKFGSRSGLSKKGFKTFKTCSWPWNSLKLLGLRRSASGVPVFDFETLSNKSMSLV
jgi:hypothetical protein